jgi:hypothetical protein
MTFLREIMLFYTSSVGDALSVLLGTTGAMPSIRHAKGRTKSYGFGMIDRPPKSWILREKFRLICQIKVCSVPVIVCQRT